MSTNIYIDKSEWIGLERIRWAEHFNIPMKRKMPGGFPPLTLSIMRALSALTNLHEKKKGQEKLCACLDEIWREWWVEHRPVHEKPVLEEILINVLGKQEAERGK
jgi:2-hydroxychromene-2-carboxylate isomerase